MWNKTAYGNQSHNFKILAELKRWEGEEAITRRQETQYWILREQSDWDESYKLTGFQWMLLVEKYFLAKGNGEGKVRENTIGCKWEVVW